MFEIRDYRQPDWPVVEAIYREGIRTGNATFETKPKSEDKWTGGSIPESQLVAVSRDGTVLGWAVLWPVSDRCVYGGVTEVSIYVAATARGKGIGKGLLNALVKRAETLGIWTMQAGIFEENIASIRLHEKCGFRIVGVRERLGALRGAWKNVVLMEKRSAVCGI
ncbi:GNAT family N-acetyltransferase [Kordiimonas aestuarii]|uniref:GNAT family N-acetyltransferase n=1 Tax=Kordiimonas aestuarii TaxID=1005925 RepID=UPI0021D0585B|nr:GNAT family N-acetyltransferase [Kordiimonas aestuarii]